MDELMVAPSPKLAPIAHSRRHSGIECDDEFRVTLRVRNNPLLSAMEAGYKNVARFCEAHHISRGLVDDLLNLKSSPLTTDRKKWRPITLRLADIFGVLPDDLFPHATRVELEKNAVSFSMAAADAAALLEDANRPDAILERKELARIMADVLKDLAPREQQVLRLKFGLDDGGERSLTEIAKELGVVVERVRQIEAKALRKMRHPGRCEKLRAFLTYEETSMPDPVDSFSWEAWNQQAIEQGEQPLDKEPVIAPAEQQSTMQITLIGGPLNGQTMMAPPGANCLRRLVDGQPQTFYRMSSDARDHWVFVDVVASLTDDGVNGK